ncbi:hypothetical protein WJ970_21170 [Achromobacter xylosoxidans]
MAGGNLTVTTSGAIDNQRGLLQADDTLTLTASPDNSNIADRQQRACQGRAGQGGQYRGRAREQPGRRDQRRPGSRHQNWRVGQRCRDIAARGAARIDADALDNTRGQIALGQGLRVLTGHSQGLGSASGEDLAFEYAGSLNQEGQSDATGRDSEPECGRPHE